MQPTGSIDDFLGMLAGKTRKIATIEEINEAAAAGWAGKK
ncbi:MAG: AbrB/MazE/SpoVT family DNA-binding domain-containing protein, partial [Burkholderiaceae bacterium]